jgi:hypothetical protein
MPFTGQRQTSAVLPKLEGLEHGKSFETPRPSNSFAMPLCGPGCQGLTPGNPRTTMYTPVCNTVNGCLGVGSMTLPGTRTYDSRHGAATL